MFTGKSLLITTAGALIIGFVGGLNAGSVFSLGDGLSKAQVEKLKMSFPMMSEMRAFSGTVKKINGNTITLEIAESTNPFDEWPTVRKVLVTDTTRIVRISSKDSMAYQKEMNAYLAATVKAGGDPAKTTSLPPPPSFTKEEVIKPSDLKAGDTIIVEADSNIKTETQFTAVKISINISVSAGMPAPIMPAPGIPTP